MNQLKNNIWLNFPLKIFFYSKKYSKMNLNINEKKCDGNLDKISNLAIFQSSSLQGLLISN